MVKTNAPKEEFRLCSLSLSESPGAFRLPCSTGRQKTKEKGEVNTKHSDEMEKEMRHEHQMDGQMEKETTRKERAAATTREEAMRKEEQSLRICQQSVLSLRGSRRRLSLRVDS